MRKKTGFTLIELLVVVAIIALLLSILTPALNQVKETGKKIVCNSNVRQLGMAYTMYAELYGGRFVPVEIWGPLADEALKSGGYDMTLSDGEVITPWIPIWCFNKQFIKLLDQRGSENAGLEIVANPFDYYALPPKFRCPSFPVDKKEEFGSLTSTTIIRTTYAPNMTDWVRAVEESGGDDSPQARSMEDRIWNKGVPVDEIKRPADKILFTDAKDVYLSYAGDQGNYILHWDVHGEIGWTYTSNDGLDHGPEPMYRHNEGANIAFCDGHTEYRKKKEIFYFLDGNHPDADGTNVDVLRNDKLWCYFK